MTPLFDRPRLLLTLTSAILGRECGSGRGDRGHDPADNARLLALDARVTDLFAFRMALSAQRRGRNREKLARSSFSPINHPEPLGDS